jgi:hypothetical protein
MAMNRLGLTAFLCAMTLAVGPVLADDLTGSDRFLCTSVLATSCGDDGECESAPPWELNIPQFIKVDLDARTLSTTKTSGENRSTRIKSVERENGLIILQGSEQGRAFSFVITEETGMSSIAVARDGLAVAVFGACLPTKR